MIIRSNRCHENIFNKTLEGTEAVPGLLKHHRQEATRGRIRKRTGDEDLNQDKDVGVVALDEVGHIFQAKKPCSERMCKVRQR